MEKEDAVQMRTDAKPDGSCARRGGDQHELVVSLRFIGEGVRWRRRSLFGFCVRSPNRRIAYRSKQKGEFHACITFLRVYEMRVNAYADVFGES